MKKNNSAKKNNELQGKSKFVLDILDFAVNKNIDEKTRAKLFTLIGSEIGKSDFNDEEILRRLEKIEAIVIDKNTFGTTQGVTPSHRENEIYNGNNNEVENKKHNKIFHNPIAVSKFLENFRENTDLKWTTHVWDEKKYDTIQDFIGALNKSKEYKKLYDFNINLYNLIRYFIYTPKTKIGENGVPEFGWPNHNDLKIGWQYPNHLLINWCKENYDNKETRKYPFQYDLPKELQPKRLIKGRVIKTFENVVDVFKTEIQFRENYFFKEIEKRKNRMSDFEFIGLEEFAGLDFYTYTSGVLGAIDVILTEIKRNETAKKILFSYKTVENKLTIDILHLNSFPTRLLDSNNLHAFLGGGLNSIAEHLFSLCDFSVISKFRSPSQEEINGELMINYEGTTGELIKKSITLKSIPSFKQSSEFATGFTYRLTFYL